MEVLPCGLWTFKSCQALAAFGADADLGVGCIVWAICLNSDTERKSDGNRAESQLHFESVPDRWEVRIKPRIEGPGGSTYEVLNHRVIKIFPINYCMMASHGTAEHHVLWCIRYSA